MFGRSLYIIVALVVASISLFFSRKSSAPNLDQPRRFPGRNNTVLFLTDSHAGNSNVHVAASHALLLEFPDLEIHFASFPKLEKAITATSKFAVQQKPSTAPIIFHPLEGKTFTEAVGYSIEDAIQRPGLGGIERLCSNMQRFLMPWTASDYVALYEHIMGVLDEVDPIVVITDSLLSPALDATRAQGRNHVTLSPNSLKDNFASMQPWGSMFWKYPAISSGHPYPVPWHLIPANIYLNIRFIYSVLHTPLLTEKKTFLKQNGIAKPLDVFSIYQKDYLWLTPSLPELEFPISFVPSNVVACGPIFRSSAPAADQDPELAAWLALAPTVLINLGSTVDYSLDSARELVGAIKTLLENSKLQVLWKFVKRGEYSEDVFLEVSKEIKDGRLRVEKWLGIDPAAMMETGNIVVSVHHGGANCFFEAVAVGIPQVVLPLWGDHYDYATRVEYLGIGVFGSPKSAPNWTAEEVGNAFLRVLDGGDESTSIKEKARALGEVARKAGGRSTAAREIAKLARTGSV